LIYTNYKEEAKDKQGKRNKQFKSEEILIVVVVAGRFMEKKNKTSFETEMKKK